MEEYIRILAASIIQLCQITYIIIEQMGPYLTVVLFSLFLIASVIFIHTHFTYWTRRGVKQKFPFRDDMTKKIIQKRAFGDMVMEIYNRFIGTRYVGFYQFHKPILMLKDPTLIGLVCDRNFFSFKNHTNLVPPNCDPLWNKTVFSLKGRSWHRARSHLEPFFSDRRLWNLFEVTRAYSYDFTNALVPIRSQVLEANFKELFAKCITEIMARSVFDLHNNSFRLNNMFYTKLRESTEDFGTKELMKILLAQTFPCFGKFWNARVFSEKLSSCFTEVVEKIKSHRDRLGIEKLDLISLLMGMKAREINNQVINTVLEHDPGTHVTNEVIERDLIRVGIDLTEETTVAQAMSFFYFGYDVISTVLCFLFYELAQNRDVQERLIKDLDACRAKQKGFSLSELFKVPYLSMVIAETLRKWPPFYFTERYCNKTFNIEKKFPHEKHARISPGDSVWIPIWAIHRDPKYWWNPEVFDPERFLLENHHKRCPNTFIPFGMGPRSCPGAKMAVMQIKIIVNEILTIFEIVPVKNTPHSVVLDHRTFNLSPADGLWLGLKKRFM